MARGASASVPDARAAPILCLSSAATVHCGELIRWWAGSRVSRQRQPALCCNIDPRDAAVQNRHCHRTPCRRTSPSVVSAVFDKQAPVGSTRPASTQLFDGGVPAGRSHRSRRCRKSRGPRETRQSAGIAGLVAVIG
jgi:hypothetical protein